VLGAEQADKAIVRGRDQDGSLPRPACWPDIVPEHIGIKYDRRRARQERRLQARTPDRSNRTVSVHVSDHAADEGRGVLREPKPFSTCIRLLNGTGPTSD
jgi:hypothetical protein